MAGFPELMGKQKLAYLCKALSFQTKDTYLVKVRAKLIPLLIENGLQPEVKVKLDRTIKTYETNGWCVPESLISQQKMEWYLATETRKVNPEYGKGYISATMHLLYHDIPKVICAISGVDRKSRKVYFIGSREMGGSFILPDHEELPVEGDIVALRLEERSKGEGKCWRMLTHEPTDEMPSGTIYREVTGRIVIRQGQSFGFLDNCYVPDTLISEHWLLDGIRVSGSAIASFNQKKGQWGWKVVKIALKIN